MGARVGGVGSGVAEGAGDRRGQRTGVGLDLSGRHCVGGGGGEGAAELKVWCHGSGGCAAEGGSGQDEDENGEYGYGYGWWWWWWWWWWRSRSSRGKEDAMTDTTSWLTCSQRAIKEGKLPNRSLHSKSHHYEETLFTFVLLPPLIVHPATFPDVHLLHHNHSVC